MRNAFAMKCVLNQAPLTCVQRVFAGKEAVAHYCAASLHDRPANLLGSMHDEELLDEVGMVQEECISPAQTEFRDVPIARSQPL
jgi:hypothetical protein